MISLKTVMGAKLLSHQQPWMLARVGNAEMEFRSQAQDKATQEKITTVLNIIVMILIVVGTFHYVFIQKAEYGNKFSW
jgi:hypothetical protein